jgi:hypothetical protein
MAGDKSLNLAFVVTVGSNPHFFSIPNCRSLVTIPLVKPKTDKPDIELCLGRRG